MNPAGEGKGRARVPRSDRQTPPMQKSEGGASGRLFAGMLLMSA
jgi:hypothetical protein